MSRINDKAETAIKEIENDLKSENRWTAIQTLISLGLAAVEAELQKEIAEVAGVRYSRRGDIKH